MTRGAMIPGGGTIRSEGALFPPDFLQRLAAGSSEVPGLRPEDYHLAGREKLSEAASRSWNRLLGLWEGLRQTLEALPGGDRATALTREKWLLPLFSELGYGRLASARGQLKEAGDFPISHLWQGVPIHLVGANVGLDERTPGVAGAARRSPHGLLQEYLNTASSQWGFVSNGLTLRLLRAKRTLTRQAYVEFDLAAMMDGQAFSDFALLWLLSHESRLEIEAINEPELEAAGAEPGGDLEEGDEAEAAPPPAAVKTCWLERWAALATQQGTRALDELRDGVERAIRVFGTGFLRHPGNRRLLEKLRRGDLSRQDYYRQLLRLVYRLIFLLVAEARDLLLVGPSTPESDRYRRFYSISRLRDLAAARRGTAHGDLWQAFQIVVRALSSPHGCSELALPPLGGLLWSDAAAPDLDCAQLANSDLLEAVRALAFRLERGVRRPVDWRNLGAEELGSVYESLLELRPDVNPAAASFALQILPGHERKTTGSYYTPSSLVECLLDTALDPVLDEAAKSPDPAAGILRLRVCDPACGSGHFLIAAAHRIAHRLARTRTGDAEPAPAATRHALREVIGHCLYGVDMNPMAVELCKVSLWLEALEPGRPLSFLDAHIQCGNALLGATPALLRGGIPDAAFDALTGDDKEWCKLLKRANKKERLGFKNLFADEPWMRLGDIAAQVGALDDMDDSTAESVRKKERRYAEIVHSADYEHGRLLADAWCAAFLLPKRRDEPSITEDTFRQIERNPLIAPEPLQREIRTIAEAYPVLHWHLAFPDVFRVPAANEAQPDDPGWSGGFHVILGNPPWNRVKLQEKEWFAERRPEIAAASKAATRKSLIAALESEDPSLWRAWLDALRISDCESALVRSSGRYPLCGRGDVNTYSIFAELNRSLLDPQGRAGFIVPTGIATDDTTKFFFQNLVDQNSLISLYDFQSGPGLFSEIGHARFKFSLVTLEAPQKGLRDVEFAFFLRSVAELQDPERRFGLSGQDIALLNPNTRTCPIFRSRRDAVLTKAIYRRVPVLVNEALGEAGNPLGISFMTMFHMSGDSHLFRTGADLRADGWTLSGNIFERSGERYLPLYEAKMVHQFNHRFGDYADKDPNSKGSALPTVPDARLADPTYVVQPRYWVKESEVEAKLRDHGWDRPWLLGWRDITNATNERTVIASVLPRGAIGGTLPICLARTAQPLFLVAALNSFACDYVARQKVGGTHLNYPPLRQIAAPNPQRPARGCDFAGFVQSRVAELIFTSHETDEVAGDLGWEVSPFQWDQARRFLLRCELDAAFFHLYLPVNRTGSWEAAESETAGELATLTELFPTPRDAVSYILDTFPIVRRKDEAAFGEYRTKRVILEIYDAMAEAIRTGIPYQSRLDPPPADPRAAHGAAAAVAQTAAK